MKRPGYRTASVAAAAASYGANVLTQDEQDFEGGIGTWVAHDGASAVAQSTDQAKAGSNSLKVTGDGGGAVICRVGPDTFSATTNYRLEIWVYLPSGWAGGDIKILTNLSDDSSIVSVATAVEETWTLIYTTLTTGADTSGHTLIQTTNVTSDVFYIDEAYVREVL